MLILVLVSLIMNTAEYILLQEGIELRTFVQVGKGMFLWLIVPIVCALLLYGIARQEWKSRKDTSSLKWLSIVLTLLLVIAFILILGITFFRGMSYVLTTQYKEEKKIEGNILMVTESNWDSTTTSYYETKLFFFRKPFMGYDRDTLIQQVQEKYEADAQYQGSQNGIYQFKGHIKEPIEADFVFQVKNDYLLTTNYGEEIKYILGEAFFEKKNRAHSWTTTNAEVGETHLLWVNCYGRAEMEWFCNDITELMEYYLQNEYLKEHIGLIEDIGIVLDREQNAFYIRKYLSEYDRTGLYNYLYENMEQWINDSYKSGISEEDDFITEPLEEAETKQNNNEATQEQKQYYLSIEPACTFITEEGLEYRVLEVDRACGSSYYSLIATADGGKICALVNKDPFLGSGGGARWITFINKDVGFVGMCYSGGSLGMLFRTEDGGQSFKGIEYPLPQIALPDGTYYNPFVMPERVYEEGDTLYLECGQGPDGDYKGGDN